MNTPEYMLPGRILQTGPWFLGSKILEFRTFRTIHVKCVDYAIMYYSSGYGLRELF